VDETPIEIDDPLVGEFAKAALDRLEELQREAPGVMRRILEGSRQGAQALNADPIAEVVQNADDAQARDVRIGVQSGARPVLLMAHSGGERIGIDHVLPMSFAFLSTKREVVDATGKFGVGLQTLNSLGGELEVHCPPYSFAVEGPQLRRIPSKRAIRGIYDPSAFDTLLVLHLRPTVDLERIRGWVANWGADSMLFLRHVRRIAAIDPSKPTRARATIELRKVRVRTISVRVRGRDLSCQSSQLSDRATMQRFARFVVDLEVPNAVPGPDHKKIGTSTPIAFALGGARGRFFAGLPLPLAPSLPWSIHAQFDPEPSRNSLKHSAWNEWLLKRVADVISGVVVELFRQDPATAWSAVPLGDELGEQPDPWLQDRVKELFHLVQANVARRVRIGHAGRELRLADLAYEDATLTGMLTAAEVARLSGGKTLVPSPMRDREGRWRLVLDELGVSTNVGITKLRDMLAWSDLDLAHRDPRWLSRVTAVLVQADPDATWNDRCLVLGDGRRTSPRDVHDKGLLVVRDSSVGGLAQRLGLVVALHSDYLGRGEAARVVQSWLTDTELLVTAPADRDALAALARLPKDVPRLLRDDELRALREAVASLPASEHRSEILREVGQRVAVDGGRYVDRRLVKEEVRISRAYLPAAFEGRAATWARAAGRVPVLRWVDRRYADILRMPGERGPSAAREFLHSLGAEVAPRLQATATTTFNREVVQPFSAYSAPELQARAAAERGYLRFVRGDHTSIALQAVARDIAQARTPRRRVRAAALLRTLHDSWERLYADHAEIRAFAADRTLLPRGRLPASWIAGAGSLAWMDNELGEPCAPCDLVVRTAEYLSAIGNEPAVFARQVDGRQARWPVVGALGIASRPRAKHLVDQLVELQRRDVEPLSDDVLDHARLIYAALASMCPDASHSTPDAMVDDLSVRNLRQRLSGGQRRPGLVRTSSGWYAPSQVFSGRPIFGSRRPFVPAGTGDPLWRTLRIESPSVDTCISVLREIARDSTGPKERATLTEIYRYLHRRLRDGARRPATLRRLPLWTGDRWTTTRPVYAVDDRELAETLAARPQPAIWQAPAALDSLESFLQGARISKVNEGGIRLAPGTRRRALADSFLRERFQRATLHLRAALAEEDEAAHDCLAVDWDAFHGASVSIARPLEVDVRVGSSRPIRAERRAQLDLPDLTLYVTDMSDLADENAGGYAVATAFQSAKQREIALRWTAAWRRAERGEEPRLMRLAQRQQDDIRKLLEQMEASARTAKPPLKPRQKPPKRTNNEPGAEATALKVPADLTHGVEVAIVEPDASGTTIERRGIRTSPHPGRHREFEPRSSTPRADVWDPEDIAIEAVRQALWQIDEREMEDVSRLRGLGADGLRDDEFIEVKHNRRGLPTSVTLLANEHERATREGTRFVLALAYDLEKGMPTKVRFYPDPLNALPKLPPTSVTLVGFKAAPALEVTFAPPSDVETLQRRRDNPTAD
jgi:hypothetical protein